MSVYNIAKRKLADGDLDFEAADLRLLLIDASGSYTFDADDEFVADLTPASNELDTTGYSRVTLANVSASTDTTNDRAEIDFDNPSWASLGPASSPYPDVEAAVVFVQVTNDNDSWLVGYFSVSGTASGSKVELGVPTDGAFWVS